METMKKALFIGFVSIVTTLQAHAYVYDNGYEVYGGSGYAVCSDGQILPTGLTCNQISASPNPYEYDSWVDDTTYTYYTYSAPVDTSSNLITYQGPNDPVFNSILPFETKPVIYTQPVIPNLPPWTTSVGYSTYNYSSSY